MVDGCDLVSHEHIVPMAIDNRFQRIVHEWYAKCFDHDQTASPSPTEFFETVRSIRQRQLYEYQKETHGIKVSVTPFFVGEVKCSIFHEVD